MPFNLQFVITMVTHRWLQPTPGIMKTTMKTASMGSHMTLRTIQKIMWGKIFSGPLANRALRYPNLVPWDQNFWSHFFLLISSYDVYLYDFLIYLPKTKVY